MTYKQLQDDVLERFGYDFATASTAPRTRIKRFINEAYRKIVRETGMSRLTWGVTAITLADGQQDYNVTAASIRSIYDLAQNRVLPEVTLAELRLFGLESDVTGAEPNLADGAGRPYVYAQNKINATTRQVSFYPVPDSVAAGDKFNVDCEQAILELSSDGDIPAIPEDWHYLLSLWARVVECEKLEQMDRRNMLADQYERDLGKFRLYLAKARRRVNFPDDVQFSRLGPFYEANT